MRSVTERNRRRGIEGMAQDRIRGGIACILSGSVGVARLGEGVFESSADAARDPGSARGPYTCGLATGGVAGAWRGWEGAHRIARTETPAAWRPSTVWPTASANVAAWAEQERM